MKKPYPSKRKPKKQAPGYAAVSRRRKQKRLERLKPGKLKNQLQEEERTARKMWQFYNRFQIMEVENE